MRAAGTRRRPHQATSPTMAEESPNKMLRRRSASAHHSVEFFSDPITSKSVFTVKLKKMEEKYSSLVKVNKDLQLKLTSSEAHVEKLNSSLVMSTYRDYTKTVTGIANSMTETMNACKESIRRITSEYNKVIVKLQTDNETLRSQAERQTTEKAQYLEKLEKLSQKEAELADLKPKYQMLLTEVESYRKELGELGEDDRCLQKRTFELEVSTSKEKGKLPLICADETEKWDKQRLLHETEMQKLLKEIEGLEEKSKNVEDEKNNVVQLLVQKEEEIKHSEQAVNYYKESLEVLETELAEKTTCCQHANDKIVKYEALMLENNAQIAELAQALETLEVTLLGKLAYLASVEEAKRALEQKISKKELQLQNIETVCSEVKTKMEQKLEVMQENMSQRASELQELQNQWREVDSQKESISTDLMRANDLLETVQKENEEVKNRLALFSSIKEGEVEDLKSQLEHLSKQMEERELKFTAEIEEMTLKYEESEVKYQNEITVNRQNCENSAAELNQMNGELQELREMNKRYLEEMEKLNEEVNSLGRQLETVSESNAELNEKLQSASAQLKSSEQTIQTLNETNQELDIENKNLVEMERKLKTAEQTAEEFQQKYFDANADFNQKMGKVKKELDDAKLKLVISETNDQRALAKRESLEKNLEACTKRAQVLEVKYCTLHEAEVQRFERQQVVLEEIDRQAQEFEEKFRKLRSQEFEFNRNFFV